MFTRFRQRPCRRHGPHAYPGRPRRLRSRFPTPGDSFRLSLSAEQVTFTCDKKTHTISLKGSVSLQAGLPSPAHPLSLPMTVTSAELSGTSSAFGKVMASLDGTPIGELVKQGVATPFPARHDLPLKLNITFERAACGGGANAAQSSMRRAAESLVLTTKDPAKLIGTLTTFRPRAACTNCKTPST